MLRQRAHRGLVLLGDEGKRRGAEGERRVRRLLQEPRRAPQRKDVQREQHDGQRDAPRLREEREHEAGERDEVPAVRAAGRLLLRHAEVRQHRREVEERRQHVAPLRSPGHRLHAQRMDGEEQRPHRGRARGRGDDRAAQQRQHDVVEEHGVHRVQQQAGEVVAGRVHAPQGVVEPERHPAEGLVMSPVDGREHPAELAPGQAPIARVVGEVEVVVPEHEVVAQGGQEAGDHHERDARRDHPGGERATAVECRHVLGSGRTGRSLPSSAAQSPGCGHGARLRAYPTTRSTPSGQGAPSGDVVGHDLSAPLR